MIDSQFMLPLSKEVEKYSSLCVNYESREKVVAPSRIWEV